MLLRNSLYGHAMSFSAVYLSRNKIQQNYSMKHKSNSLTELNELFVLDPCVRMLYFAEDCESEMSSSATHSDTLA